MEVRSILKNIIKITLGIACAACIVNPIIANASEFNIEKATNGLGGEWIHIQELMAIFGGTEKENEVLINCRPHTRFFSCELGRLFSFQVYKTMVYYI